MIKLTLLHPLQSIPIRSWTFEDEWVIRIGRATDNQVVLYSSVVSRHHVELRWTGANWEVINLGTNGTFLDGNPITHVPVVDGLIIHLARSGPKIQIHIHDYESKYQAGRITTKPLTAKMVHNDQEAKMLMMNRGVAVASIADVLLLQEEEEFTKPEDDQHGHRDGGSRG